MIRNIVYIIVTKLLKMIGDVEMMALLLAQRIILEKLSFEKVPSTLKQSVYEILAESGLEFLAGDYEPPVKED